MAAARKPKVVMNKAEVQLTRKRLALSVGEAMRRIVEEADVPDAPPLGEGLVATGGYGVWLDGKRVAGKADKPRGAEAGASGIIAFAGWGAFYARFVEFGTVKMAARPFAMPSQMRVMAHLDSAMRDGWQPGRVV